MQEEMYRRHWEQAIDEAIARLVVSNEEGLTVVTTAWYNMATNPPMNYQMEHLSCFLPGNIALGVMEQAIGPAKTQAYMQIAEKLTYTCWQMYERTATGTPPSADPSSAAVYACQREPLP